MEPLSLKDLLTAVRGAVVGPSPDAEFRHVITDSRQVERGDLFFALKGPRHDGHDFVMEVRRKGARGAIVSALPRGLASSRDFVLVRVADTARALLDLAGSYRARFTFPVVGVTGSNGKTTTKDLIGCLFAGCGCGPVVVSERSFNNHVGLPLTIFRFDRDTTRAVLELGTNAPGEIAELAAVARPQVAVITNVSESHLEGLGDLEGVRQEKATLLDSLPRDGLAVLNADDASFAYLAARAPGRIVSFGIRRHATTMALDIKCGLRSLTFRLDGQHRMLVRLTGCHNVYNTLAALAVARELGISPEACRRALQRFDRPPGRIRPVQVGNLLVLDDTFNANPGSVEAAIKTLSVLGVRGRRVLVLGDMRELGEHSEALHRRIGRMIYAEAFGLVVTVGSPSRFILEEAREKGLPESALRHFETTEDAIRWLPGALRPNDTILVKGSRALAMERVVDAILAQGPFRPEDLVSSTDDRSRAGPDDDQLAGCPALVVGEGAPA
ncbi:MAG: UDP-N-acetylmuramoyl-tripeptide--D-alanyl-D-alanine ligase [Planctomycetota bacterium]